MRFFRGWSAGVWRLNQLRARGRRVRADPARAKSAVTKMLPGRFSVRPSAEAARRAWRRLHPRRSLLGGGSAGGADRADRPNAPGFLPELTDVVGEGPSSKAIRTSSNARVPLADELKWAWGRLRVHAGVALQPGYDGYLGTAVEMAGDGCEHKFQRALTTERSRCGGSSSWARRSWRFHPAIAGACATVLSKTRSLRWHGCHSVAIAGCEHGP
jgi:hypothetical protein